MNIDTELLEQLRLGKRELERLHAAKIRADRSRRAFVTGESYKEAYTDQEEINALGKMIRDMEAM